MEEPTYMPTQEQWDRLKVVLWEAATNYWMDTFDGCWDYLVDETQEKIALILESAFPEFSGKIKQYAKERIAEMEEACRPPEE